MGGGGDGDSGDRRMGELAWEVGKGNNRTAPTVTVVTCDVFCLLSSSLSAREAFEKGQKRDRRRLSLFISPSLSLSLPFSPPSRQLTACHPRLSCTLPELRCLSTSHISVRCEPCDLPQVPR